MEKYLRQWIPGAMFIALLFPHSVQAEEGVEYQFCAPSSHVQRKLNGLGEAVKGRGIAPGGALLEVWQTVDGQDGSITITTPSRMTCMIAVFKNWEWVIWHLPTPGKDS